MIETARSEYELAVLMQEAVDCLPNGFSILDENFRPIMANRVFRTTFSTFYEALEQGLSYREAGFSLIKQSMPDASDEAVWQAFDGLARQLAKGAAVNLAMPDGKIFKTTYRPMSHGRHVAVSIDVTELARRERQLRASRQQVETVTNAKSSFLANMSHEIRTPLNGILGMAQVLVQGKLKLDQQEQVEIILDAGQALKALLDDVLDLSKIEAGRMELSPTGGDLRQLLLRQQLLWQPRAEAKGIGLRLEIDNGVPAYLSLDPTRLGQCVSNLVANAIKFTAKGDVVMRVSAAPLPDGTRISIAVSDTGIGLTAATTSRIFAPFTQGDTSMSRSFGGTSLGLVITHKLAQLMGGEVTVTSEQGKGSTFTLTLIAQAADEPLAGTDAMPPEPGVASKAELDGKRVLLVDDHPLNRRVAQLFLAPEGYRITEAENGQVALDRLAKDTFDVVLLDMHMPVLDGIGTLRRIRASAEPWHDVPVIALTADALRGDRERYVVEGVNGYVSKPVDQRALLDEIGRVIAGAAPQPHQDKAAATPAESGTGEPPARSSHDGLTLLSKTDVPRKAAVRTR